MVAANYGGSWEGGCLFGVVVVGGFVCKGPDEVIPRMQVSNLGTAAGRRQDPVRQKFERIMTKKAEESFFISASIRKTCTAI